MHTDAQPTSKDWCLECQDLDVRRGGRQIVAGVRLRLSAGNCVSIVGPNGSGKTTLMLALLGLLKPTAGYVRFNGRDWRKLSARERGRLVAYVPQVLGPAPAFRVAEIVAGGRFPHVSTVRRLSSADHAAVRSALARCGLTPLADQRFDTLSGGERQKTLIAAAMAQDPRLLFLDEPNTALDPAYQVELVHILREWNQTGRGLLLISHDLHLPAVLGGQVVALQDGTVATEGPAAEVLNPETLSKVYGTPFGSATTSDGEQIVLPLWSRDA
jgi:iron complex transport system ATP-binding protein